MDVHSTQIPAKQRRSIATKTSKKPPWQSTTFGPIRPKRTFGTVRNTNTILEKSSSTKPSLFSNNTKAAPAKPLKSKAVPAKTAVAVVEKSADGESDAKEGRRVKFQEPESKGEKREKEEEVVVCTPMPTKRDAEVPTPFFTALNCSKCRLDLLESTAYWLDQIKLAESVGKHFVSANFFRLALECHAQPLHRLRGELRYYVARHRVNCDETIWVEVFRAYGMLKEKTEDAKELNVGISLDEKDNLLLELDDDDICKNEQTGALFVELDDADSKSHDKLLNIEACGDDCSHHNDSDDLPISEPDEEDKNLTESSDGAKDVGPDEIISILVVDKIEENGNANTPSGADKLSESSNCKSKSCNEGPNPDSEASKSASKDSKTPKSGPSSGKVKENSLGKMAKFGGADKSTRISRSGGSTTSTTQDKGLKGSSGNRKLNEKKQTSPHIISKKVQLSTT